MIKGKEIFLSTDGSFDYLLKREGLKQDPSRAGVESVQVKKEILTPGALEKMRIAFICEYCLR